MTEETEADIDDVKEEYVFKPRSLTRSQPSCQSVNAIELDGSNVDLGILNPPQPFTAPTLAVLEAWFIAWTLSNGLEMARRGRNTKNEEGQFITIYFACSKGISKSQIDKYEALNEYVASRERSTKKDGCQMITKGSEDNPLEVSGPWTLTHDVKEHKHTKAHPFGLANHR